MDVFTRVPSRRSPQRPDIPVLAANREPDHKFWRPDADKFLTG